MEESAQILEVETFIPMLLQNAESGVSRWLLIIPIALRSFNFHSVTKSLESSPWSSLVPWFVAGLMMNQLSPSTVPDFSQKFSAWNGAQPQAMSLLGLLVQNPPIGEQRSIWDFNSFSILKIWMHLSLQCPVNLEFSVHEFGYSSCLLSTSMMNS